MNCVVISGRVSNDIELKTTQTGKKNCKFTVAIRRDKDNTDFIDCIVWDARAEFVAKNFTKGKPIEVMGELRLDKWEKEGKMQSKLYVLGQIVNYALTEKKIEVSEKPTSFGKLDSEDLPFD